MVIWTLFLHRMGIIQLDGSKIMAIKLLQVLMVTIFLQVLMRVECMQRILMGMGILILR